MVVKSERDFGRALKNVGFPMIAKPDNGVGASGAFKIENKEDFDRFVETWDGATIYFLEKFVNSSIITTYDGLLDYEGNVVFETGLTYVHTPFELMQTKKDNAYFIEKN